MSQMPVVVLDPGHGGARGTHNRGSSWNRAEGPNGLLEKNLVFDLAVRVAARLRNEARVELTRAEDANPGLAERAEVARRLDAAFFLSLHLNGSNDADADGTDVYVAHDAGDATRAFGGAVWKHLRSATGTTRGGVGARDFGTIVTARHSPRTASCLAEIAYLTNPRQARAFADEAYRDHIADALADAIRERVAPPRAVASDLAIGDGSPFVNDALKSCWDKCEQLRLGASDPNAPNVVAARRIRLEAGATVDANPYAHVGKNEIEAVIRAAFSSRAMPEVLLALWALRGDTRSITGPVAVPQATSDANARSIFRSKVYYEDIGARHFVTLAPRTSGGGRVFDDSDAAAPAHETRFAQRVADLVTRGFLREDIAGAINAELTVSRADGGRAVTPTTRFYALSLLLVDALWARHAGRAHKSSGVNASKLEHYVESFKPIFAGALGLIKPGAVDRPPAVGATEAAALDDAAVEALQVPPPLAPTFGTVGRVVTTALPGVQRFVRMPIVYDEIHGPFGAATMTTREVTTQAALRAEVVGAGFSLVQTSFTPKIAIPAVPPYTTGSTTPAKATYDRSNNADDEVANSPFFRFPGGNIEAALDSIICFPADPAHPAKLAPGTDRLPIAIIVHGNHNPWEQPPTRTAVPGGKVQKFDLPDGTKIEIRPVTLSFTPIDSYRGYCQDAPKIPAHPDPCTDAHATKPEVSYGGSPYLQEALAAIGIVSMSVSTNGANQLDCGAPFRAAYIMQYLDQLRRLDADAAGMFHNRLDFERVALIGHSRGGDAVVQAVEVNAKRPARTAAPTREGSRCTIRAVVTISPTDTSGVLNPAGAGAHPAVIAKPIRYLGIYGSHDGDVVGSGDGSHDGAANGFGIYERASTAERAMVYIHGANHARFNRVWEDECQTTMDVPSTMTRTKQERLASQYISAWLKYGIFDDPRELGLFNGSTPNSPGVPVSLMWSFGTRKEIEIHQDTNAARNTLAGGVIAPGYLSEVALDGENPADPFIPGLHLPTFPHIRRVGRANPVTGTRAPLRELIPAGHANCTGFTHLTFRITKRYPITSKTTIAAASFPNFTITLEDSLTPSKRHTVSNADILSANPRKVKPYFRVLEDAKDPFRNITKCNFETWRVPLSMFTASAPVVDLKLVRAIEFDFDAASGEPIYIDTITLVNIS